MAQNAVRTDIYKTQPERAPTLSGETCHILGHALRSVYQDTLDTQPIPDAQVDLLLRLRHRERDLRRGL